MKKIFSLFVTVALASGAFAQSSIKELNVDGLKVYFKQTPKQVISARLIVQGGTANYSLEKQGIEALAFELAVNGGTRNLDKVAFQTAAEKIGTTFGSSSGVDYGHMSMSCIKTFWDQSWKLFADAVMNPAFAESEFNLDKEQMITNAKQTESDPDGSLFMYAEQYVFKGKNYEKRPDGSSESLTALTLDEVKTYYNQTIGKARCFLVVVGDMNEQDLVSKIKETLSKLAAGSVAKKEARTMISKGGENIVDRDIATNYMVGIFTTPPLEAPDGIPMLMGMNILGDRLFIEIRTKRGLSYAPGANMNNDAITSPYSLVYVSTDSPKASIKVIVDEMNKIRKEGFLEEEVTDMKEVFLTSYFMGLETTDAQSLAIGRWAVRGNAQMYDLFTEKVNAITLKDLNRAFDLNSGSIIWTYLGKKGDVVKEDFLQPEVYKNKPY